VQTPPQRGEQNIPVEGAPIESQTNEEDDDRDEDENNYDDQADVEEQDETLKEGGQYSAEHEQETNMDDLQHDL